MNKLLVFLFLFICPFLVQAQATAKDSVRAQTTVMETASHDAVFTERNFEKGFKEKYTDSEFIYEHKAKPNSQWERFIEWLGNLLSDLFNFGNKTQNSKALIYTIRIIAIAIIAFVVYLIVKNILNKEGYWIFGRSKKKINMAELTQEQLHLLDFRKEIDNTKREENYKLAIRYYYLWLLKKLSDKETIKWHPDKTNSDYLYEIANNRLRNDFEYLSYVYEYSWYGDFPIDASAFEKAEKAFTKTFNTL